MPSTPSLPPEFHPWQASVHASLQRGRGVDLVEEIDYESGGQFTRRLRSITGISTEPTVILDRLQLSDLLEELRVELLVAPAGVDTAGLEVFVDLVEDALRCQAPSHRFDGARFGAVARDESGQVLYGHVGLGVDIAGTVRDVHHHHTFEQHVLFMPPGRYRPLPPADQASLVESLTRALAADPPADPLWRQILVDAQRREL